MRFTESVHDSTRQNGLITIFQGLAQPSTVDMFWAYLQVLVKLLAYLIIKGTSGFTSNTLLIRNSIL